MCFSAMVIMTYIGVCTSELTLPINFPRSRLFWWFRHLVLEKASLVTVSASYINYSLDDDDDDDDDDDNNNNNNNGNLLCCPVRSYSCN